MFNFGSFRQLLLGVSIDVIDQFWRAYNVPDSPARQELRYNSSAFIEGYNTAVNLGSSPTLDERLGAYERNLLGFSHMGGAMGLILLDFIPPGNQSRFQQFIARHPNHINLAHTGAGVAIQVMKKDPEQPLSLMAPLNRWWAMDGFGFYDAVSNWKQALRQQVIPNRIRGYGRRAYDQGLGRSIWFLYHTHIDNVVEQIQLFPESRRADLWSGIGLASTYTGGIGEETLQAVKAAAGSYALDVAVGSALATNARYVADNLVDHTNLATSVLCGCSAEETAQLTLQVRDGLSVMPNEPVLVQEPVYEAYRKGIRAQLTPALAMA